MKIFTDNFISPIGKLKITASEFGVVGCDFIYDNDNLEVIPNKITDECIKQLEEYFNKVRYEFSLPLEISGTNFQKAVWNQLIMIDYGRTATYKNIAVNLNNPKAVRAVGNANNKNKIAIIIPCHRVIGSNGKLVGYAGGLDKKEWLLKHEGVV
ncbi:MAG: cysteine methyltransferase [Bacillales bacterium]|jgi:methylated-DNA-[protein]-cysteine S-methyltransferase|nr:cysteine methyltransferase [Bacillales bacterium]